MSRAVADASAFITQETGRELGDLPERIAVSVVNAACFARIASAELSRGRRRLRLHDTPIAATALRYNAAVITQDADFSAFDELTLIQG